MLCTVILFYCTCADGLRQAATTLACMCTMFYARYSRYSVDGAWVEFLTNFS